MPIRASRPTPISKMGSQLVCAAGFACGCAGAGGLRRRGRAGEGKLRRGEAGIRLDVTDRDVALLASGQVLQVDDVIGQAIGPRGGAAGRRCHAEVRRARGLLHRDLQGLDRVGRLEGVHDLALVARDRTIDVVLEVETGLRQGIGDLAVLHLPLLAEQALRRIIHGRLDVARAFRYRKCDRLGKGCIVRKIAREDHQHAGIVVLRPQLERGLRDRQRTLRSSGPYADQDQQSQRH